MSVPFFCPNLDAGFLRSAFATMLLLWSAQVSWSQCSIQVVSTNGPLPGAVVWSEGEPIGMTNEQGLLEWASTTVNSMCEVRVRAIGYAEEKWNLTCSGGVAQRISLKDMAVVLGGATVVGSLRPMSVKASPIRTQVISGDALRALKAQDVAEALDFTNGVRETVACGICGTNDLHINGLEGVYTLVLLDGIPLLGGLASAYALDGIPLSMVQQVEVLQGPASARFGSQAVGGVVNVVLAPLSTGQAAANFRLDSHGRSQASASATFGQSGAFWQVGLDGLNFKRRIDDNGDGFTDAPTLSRGVATLRHQRRGQARNVRLTGRLFGEERFGGELDFEEGDRGTSDRYGERIDLLRSEWVFGSRPLQGSGWTYQGGAAYHRQKSTYGLSVFDAEEITANLDAYHSGWSWREGRRITGGLSLLWDRYRDETPVDSDMNVLIPAVFGEYSGQVKDASGAVRWSWIHGLRIEKPSDRAPLIAPRVNVKWSRSQWDVRLNAGRGYRRVHLFTEEHAALDGSRSVLQPKEGLSPESSWNGHLSTSRSFGNGRWNGSASVYGFATLFTDRIYADFDSIPDAIMYRNIDGVGWTRGLGSDVWMSGFGWNVNVGATMLQSEIYESSASVFWWSMGDAGQAQLFAPSWTTNLAVGRDEKAWGWNVNAQTVGVMKLPDNEQFGDESEPYVLAHASVFVRIGEPKGLRKSGRHTVTFGVRNLTNSVQASPLLGVDDPFGEDFDAARVYGPIEQRRFFLEWSWSL